MAHQRQAEAATFQYIDGFYNTRRRHSYLGGISPLAFFCDELQQTQALDKTKKPPFSGGWFEQKTSQVAMVAGVGFEPTTFRL